MSENAITVLSINDTWRSIYNEICQKDNPNEKEIRIHNIVETIVTHTEMENSGMYKWKLNKM